MIGTKRRLPSPSSLWTIRSRQKDEDRSHLEGTLRTRCREDQNRRPSFPDQQQPQARVQHCSFGVPPGDNAFRCGQLRSSCRTRLVERGSTDPTGRSVGSTAFQGGCHQRGRPPLPRCPGCLASNYGEILTEPATDSACQLHIKYYCAYSVENAAGQGRCSNARADLRRVKLCG